MARNGYLPRSELAAIPGGYLRKDAAKAFNAMNNESRSRLGVTLKPLGQDSSYRVYSRQVYWRRVWCSRGKCGNAAVPGTSPHGWGLAVDVSWVVRKAIDKVGARYGWAKRWSDASWEYWHLRWRAGVWDGKDRYARVNRYPKLRRGMKRTRSTRRATRRLCRALGLPISGTYGRRAERGVRALQRAKGLTADGVVGKRTWRAVNRNGRARKKIQKRIVRLKKLRNRAFRRGRK